MKKIGILVLTAVVFLFASCDSNIEESHIHSSVSIGYDAIGEDIFKKELCSCGYVLDSSKVENGIIVTNLDEAQEAFDKINSGVIYFKAGEYKSDDIKALSFRPTKDNIDLNKIEELEYEDFDSKKVVDIKDIETKKEHCYYRSINDLTLYAEAGTDLYVDISLLAGRGTGYDYVIGQELISPYKYYNHTSINGLTIQNFNFKDGAKLDISNNHQNVNVKFENIIVKDCNFVGNIISANSSGAISFMVVTDSVCDKIIIDNCSLVDYIRGITVNTGSNITITNTAIKNIPNSAISILSLANKYKGDILIANNTIENIQSSAIYLHSGEDAEIAISGNSFSEIKGDQNRLVFAKELEGCTYKFSSNTLDSNPIKDVSGSDPIWAVFL